MITIPKILVMGPSGVGKTSLVKELINLIKGQWFIFDLDSFGYHDKDEWIVDPSAVSTILNKHRIIALGVSNNIDEIISAKSQHPFDSKSPFTKGQTFDIILFLQVDPDELAKRGVKRDKDTRRHKKDTKTLEEYRHHAAKWNQHIFRIHTNTRKQLRFVINANKDKRAIAKEIIYYAERYDDKTIEQELEDLN